MTTATRLPRSAHRAPAWLATVGVLGSLAVTACVEPDTSTSIAASEVCVDIAARLAAVPGLTVEQEIPRDDGTRRFVLSFDQPADHDHPQRERFKQKVTLLFRSDDAPNVVSPEGYSLYQPFDSELSTLFAANVLQIEHRFFGISVPASKDWRLLTVRQAATDVHRVLRALKPVFGRHERWVSTGASKGGMAAVYHRYYFPDDVDATVAYVTPMIHGRRDTAFNDFVESRGPAGCADKIKQLQRTMLEHRAESEQRIAEYAEGVFTFDLYGISRTLDFAVIDAPFYFWRDLGASYCDQIPAPTASFDELFTFFNDYVMFDIGFTLGDRAMTRLAPWFYQSAVEIGSYELTDAHLLDLMETRVSDYVIEALPPLGVDKPFDPAVMRRIERWAGRDARRMLFVYGEDDPWSTHMFPVNARNRSYRFVVPGGIHASQLVDLPPASRDAALAHISDWLGAPYTLPAP